MFLTELLELVIEVFESFLFLNLVQLGGFDGGFQSSLEQRVDPGEEQVAKESRVMMGVRLSGVDLLHQLLLRVDVSASNIKRIFFSREERNCQ